MKEYFLKKQIAAFLLMGVLAVVGVVCLFLEGSNSLEDILEIDWAVESMEDVSKIQEDLEEAFADAFVNNGFMTELYGISCKLMGKHEVGQFAVVQDAHGELFGGALYIAHDSQIPEYAKRVRRLREVAEEHDAKLLYVSFPEKQWRCEDMASGLPLRDYAEAENEMLFSLAKNRVDSYSLLQAFQRPGVYQDRLYYRTESSLTAYGSFVAFRSILQQMEQRFGVNLDPDGYYTNPNNYETVVFPRAYLGGLGDHAGVIYSGVDNLELRNLKQPNDFLWKFIDENKVEGELYCQQLQSVEEAEARLERNVYDRSLRRVYLNGLNNQDVIINESGAGKPKILCIRDAGFSNTATYLAPLCSELHLLNASASKRQVEHYVKENDFDYVLVAISASHILENYFHYCLGG